MKHLLFPFLLIFSASVFAKTYYCTQVSNTSLSYTYPGEQPYVYEDETTDNIFKVVIDLKNEVLKVRVLDNSSETFWDLYNITKQSDDKDRFRVTATKSNIDFFTQIFSLMLTDSKKNNEVKLFENRMNVLGSYTNTFKCSRE